MDNKILISEITYLNDEAYNALLEQEFTGILSISHTKNGNYLDLAKNLAKDHNVTILDFEIHQVKNSVLKILNVGIGTNTYLFKKGILLETSNKFLPLASYEMLINQIK